MVEIYITTGLIGRYGLPFKEAIPILKKFYVYPKADKQLVCAYLQMVGVLRRDQTSRDIPPNMFKALPPDKCALLATIRKEPRDDRFIVNFWQLIDEDSSEDAIRQMRQMAIVNLTRQDRL